MQVGIPGMRETRSKYTRGNFKNFGDDFRSFVRFCLRSARFSRISRTWPKQESAKDEIYASENESVINR